MYQLNKLQTERRDRALSLMVVVPPFTDIKRGARQRSCTAHQRLTIHRHHELTIHRHHELTISQFTHGSIESRYQ